MHLDHIAKLDLARAARTGIPEVILAEGKLDSHLVATAKAYAEKNGRAVVSRLAPERLALFASLPFERQYDEDAKLLVLAKAGTNAPRTGGRVLVLAAGTADVAIAEEARLVAEELGCETRRAYDVGVAGIHRLFPELDHAEWSDVIIVAAGREGALATVVAGLVDRPVIGLPVSTGYGHGGKGEAALSSMLQACSPLVVVNIDAGVVAGACAAQIANRVARARNSSGESRLRTEDSLVSVARRESP
ncbi:MAG: nickel pincer cofactor biosynthesis protein LarB [Candidatus Thermoplasmatota archaeon]